ncbi:hypothetical protein BJ170DRAFT_617380 [Xylariales sp. AK1849]|nr:hypothetical protein BJ170DRAFT_617380 [Xylariales sp. AK1849]
MSSSWLPDACYDEELMHEFEALQAWHWYRDPSGTQPVPTKEVLRGDMDRLFVSFEYHRAHCVFMWKKLHRALAAGQLVDSYIGNYDHTSHCGHMLMMGNESLDSLNTQIVRKFPACSSKEAYLGT